MNKTGAQTSARWCLALAPSGLGAMPVEMISRRYPDKNLLLLFPDLIAQSKGKQIPNSMKRRLL
jgi:hypothetical protein